MTKFIILVILVSVFNIIQSRNVLVDVKVPWKRYSTSSIAELSEFLSDQSDNLFWNYVDGLCAETTRVEAALHTGFDESGADIQSIAFEVASSVASPSLHALMDTTLGLGVNLPAVRFYDSLSESVDIKPCGAQAFAIVYPSGEYICSPDDLSARLQSPNDVRTTNALDRESFLFPQTDGSWDHVYSYPSTDVSSLSSTNDPISGSSRRHSFVLYGTIGTKSFCALHHSLVHVAPTFVPTSALQYSVRHSFHNATILDESSRVQGFGIFLDIKNVEYKTGDDSVQASGSSGTQAGSETDKTQSASFLPGEEIAGVVLATLAERRPHLVDELSLLKAELTNKVVEGGSEMKMWQVKELGLQTLAAVMTAASPIDKLTEIVHNFPLHAPSLSAIKVSDSLRAEFGEDSIWQRGAAGSVSLNSMYVNGIRIDLSGATFNIYDLLKQVRFEITQLEQLEALNLPASLQAGLRHAALKLSAEGDEQSRRQSLTSIVRVDVSKGGKHVVHFINNLEKDKVYKSWPKKLSTLLKPSWELHAIARNMYTFIAVIDPVDPTGAELLLQLHSMLQQKYPIRFGFVLYCGHHEVDEMVAAKSLQARVCRLFSQAKTYGTEEATSFVMEVASEVSKLADNARRTNKILSLTDDFTEHKLSRLYSDTIIATSSKRLLASDLVTEAKNIQQGVVSNETNELYYPNNDFVTNTSAYLQARGLPINSFSMNGIVLSAEALSEAMMQLLGREQYILAMAVRSGQLTDKSGSIFNSILELNPDRSYTRYHRILEETTAEYIDIMHAKWQSVLSSNTFFYDYAMVPDSAHKLEDADGFVNSVLVLASVTQKGLSSIREASLWIAGRSAIGSHRLAVSFLLSSQESDCLSAILKQVQTESSSDEAGISILSRLEHVCKPILNDDEHIANLQRVVAQEIAVRSLPCIHFKEAKDDVSVATISSTGDVISPEEGLAEVDYSVSFCTRHETALWVDRFHAFKSIEYLTAELGGADNAMVVTSLQHLLHRSTLAKTALGWAETSTNRNEVCEGDENDMRGAATEGSTSSSSSSPSNNANAKLSDQDDVTVVLYNARKLQLLHGAKNVQNSAKMDAPLTSEDLILVASIEYNRLGSGLDGAIISNPLPSVAKLTVPERADLTLRMASFIGMYGGNSAVQRSDVVGGLAEGGIELTSSASVGSTSGGKKQGSKKSVALKNGAMEVFVAPSANTGHSSSLSVVYLIDPLSVAGQRAVSLVKLFRDSLRIPQTLVLVPRQELTEFPLQNFYRYVLAPHAGVPSSSTSMVTEGAAVFRSLPLKHVLTTRIDGPEPWNIQALSASQDLDNLQCLSTAQSSNSGLHGTTKCGDINTAGVVTDWTSISYALKNILFTGSCTQTMFGRPHHVPPNGLQLTFTRTGLSSLPSIVNVNDSSTSAEPRSDLMERLFESTDTLVMQNLGYFQMKANPGLWNLNLAVGRARYLYSFESSGSSSDGREIGKIIAVKSFSDVFYRLNVHKRTGLESIPLLQEADDNSEDEYERFGEKSVVTGSVAGMWDSLTSYFKPASDDTSSNSNTNTKKSTKSKQQAKLAALASSHHNDEDNKIHVFSLATGHMYERLLRIMMLSVTKRTSLPVKFWLLENYLSPTFKEIVAKMASVYGFEVGYVTYKWPEWLRQQTQKQRIIWGYKILFLDVLFPLNVKKVIYVDADQVLRADLKELWDLDLQGKPYAYTPFCTSRAETLGFQFWRSGYWADHLRGKPYHISALYVVDLQKFRRNAVGDALRGIYDGLARDPNSLANLDQDLPNYAQHAVPIHSLPQSWLWCETWCSDESKSKAKTIDLCNNPLHKEPKLDMARRIVSGKLFNESWVELDDEIRQLEIAGGFRSAE